MVHGDWNSDDTQDETERVAERSLTPDDPLRKYRFRRSVYYYSSSHSSQLFKLNKKCNNQNSPYPPPTQVAA